MKGSESGLARGEWIAVSGGVLLAVSLLVLPWFAVTVDGFVQPGLDGAAFELLAGLDVVLLLAALIPLVVPALRAGPLGVRLGDGASRLVAVAGLAAALLTLYVMVAPPAPDVLGSGALESSADVGLTPRAGAFIGLAASLAILGGGAIEMATAAAARQAARLPRPQAAEAPQPPAPAAVASPESPAAPASTAPTVTLEAPATKPSKAKATKPAKKRAPAAKARKPAAAKTRKLSFAAATESQLRGLGLSTTQARRVLRYRDELGLVSGVGELDVIPGLPKATVSELKSKLGA